MTVEVTQSNPFLGIPSMRRGDSRGYAKVAKQLLEQTGLLETIRRDGGGRTDAAYSAAFARELEYRYTETFDVEFSKFKARSLIPVDTRVPSGDEFFSYKQFTKIGDVARISHSYTDDAPQPELAAAEFPQRIVSLRAAYSFSVQDMRAAAEAGRPFESMKAEATREMIERKIEDLAAFGTPQILQPDGATQMYGLLNAPNVNRTAGVYSSVTASNDWITLYNADASTGKSTSVAGILADVNAMIGTIFNQLKGEGGDVGTLTMVLPTPLYLFLRQTVRNTQFDATGQSLLEYVQKACGLKEIDFWNRCDAAALTGASAGKGRIMVYEKNPRVVSLIISQDFEQFAPEKRNMSFVVDCHARTGAVTVRYPLRITFMDGASP